MPALAGGSLQPKLGEAVFSKPMNAGDFNFADRAWNRKPANNTDQTGPAGDRLSARSNHHAVRDHAIARDDHDAISDVIEFVVKVLRLAGR